MRAVVLDAHGGSENFRLAVLSVPTLRPGDVGIRVRAISFNPIDYQIRKGKPAGSPVASPVLGRDLSGVVDSVASGVEDIVPGDEVYSYIGTLASSGAYAEYVAVPAELVALKPRSLSHEQAAAVPVGAVTAIMALQKLDVGPATSLFVAGGAGGMGSFALALARTDGVRRLVTTAGNAASRAYLVDKCGIDDANILDYRDPAFLELALARNGGLFDCVLDLVGGAMLSACCKLVAVDGQLASVTEAPSESDFEYLFQKNASFHAVGANAYMLADDRKGWLKYRAILQRLAQLFDSGTLAPPQVTIFDEFSVESVQRAHALMERGGVQGKLVMSLGKRAD